MNLHAMILVGVRMKTSLLTDEELAALYTAITAGFDPRPVIGYEKVAPLFTEQQGTRLHAETLAALDSIVAERIR